MLGYEPSLESTYDKICEELLAHIRFEEHETARQKTISLQEENERLRREREDARFVARLVARLAGLDEKRIDWEEFHEL